ncbi:hypothetical protein AURANDRAFT_67495 [Aureococcus anophagefferens]|uniref:Uncharacterized protein n=1 Tax=Aureococcus anophagefferens TaxID=44056 RepID=F0YLC6_AURAN|nr:hypothetical protein AURANDRAFT_67495 [Aureococcus anophagefferens]EGB04104.1 hypothetical protein AURANDRAFT_67495 [Aureococcus anophagefferens]|eukprot:XP_009041229.1 hypothetical protein AURANDRAFT_67495 [Aureococcus anophagefferens]
MNARATRSVATDPDFFLVETPESLIGLHVIHLKRETILRVESRHKLPREIGCYRPRHDRKTDVPLCLAEARISPWSQTAWAMIPLHPNELTLACQHCLSAGIANVSQVYNIELEYKNRFDSMCPRFPLSARMTHALLVEMTVATAPISTGSPKSVPVP